MQARHRRWMVCMAAVPVDPPSGPQQNQTRMKSSVAIEVNRVSAQPRLRGDLDVCVWEPAHRIIAGNSHTKTLDVSL